MTIVVCVYANWRIRLLEPPCSRRVWVMLLPCLGCVLGTGSSEQFCFIVFNSLSAIWPCQHRRLTINHGPPGACTLVLVAKTNISPHAPHPPVLPIALTRNLDARFCNILPHTALPTCSSRPLFHVSLFWGGITVGRLLAVPLAVRFSASFLLRANLLGALLSSVLLLMAGRVSARSARIARCCSLSCRGWISCYPLGSTGRYTPIGLGKYGLSVIQAFCVLGALADSAVRSGYARQRRLVRILPSTLGYGGDVVS